MTRVKQCTAFASAIVMGWINVSNGETLFFEDFEGDLSRWVGKSGGHHGQIVDDPLESDRVLTFTVLNSGGDIFSTLINNPSGEYILSFDYLGLRKQGSVDDDFGGFIGYSYGLPDSQTWLGGTQANYPGLKVHLPDTEQWERITMNFNAGTDIRLMLEDFSGSVGVTGDAFFDNILLTDGEGPNLVTLNNFTATHFQNDIRIHWKTASEVDNAGFHIWRASGEGWKDGDYSQVIRITDQLIPSKGNKVGGYPYSYIDYNVESGITYYYGLEDIDFNGQSTVHWDFIDETTAK
jgi:hypothetical protein